MPQAYRISDNLQDAPHFDVPAVVTIGTFDGVHLGHQAVLNYAKSYSAPVIAITFSNHPAQVLRPQQAVVSLCTPEYKYRLLAKAGVDHVIALSFTPELSQLSPQDFLANVRRFVPFSNLVLGHDARIGKNREGDQQLIQALAKEHHFAVEYLPPLTFEGQVVSSTRIRECIKNGDLSQGAKLLGRPISYYGEPMAGKGLGTKLGFPTLNIDVTNLCTPPLGVYAVTVVIGGNSHPAIANIGKAPTVRDDQRVLLETFLLDAPASIPAGPAEVFLRSFIRPERKFDSLDELKAQIEKDVALALQS
ncbi:MAG: bifunctional riboflavin kinase/FAD synthetase [Chlamydiales bacterium]|nr:bifunctional riboflavin kinase/FAD synthetase [Chlamydiales bacterium]